jgi:hypothetical protein
VIVAVHVVLLSVVVATAEMPSRGGGGCSRGGAGGGSNCGAAGSGGQAGSTW